MGTEIEAKIKVPDLRGVRKKLEASGATRIGKVLESNSFYDTAARSLQSADTGLRIRVAVDESGQSKCTVTMKGPLQRGQFKTREETEFSADDPGAVRTIFENLGYHLTLSFQKHRESWKLGGCEVELDELPYLGAYVEIEGPGEKTVDAVRHSLGLENLPLIATGYISLLARYLEEHQIKDRQIRF
ncbi:MAG TPA: class IV adenylate cyclase [Tepidisphaeraceae bacterium]|jgi:adenylate cyclase class 2|nr:class IV adenylate cyclase [Tepidisphaeraceae bacterium]